MRILMLSPIPIFPLNAGDRVRIWHLANGLAYRHAVTLVLPDDGYLGVGGDPGFTAPHLRLAPTPWSPPGVGQKVQSLVSARPYHVALRYRLTLLQTVERLAAQPYDLVYCHQLYTLPYACTTGLPALWDQQNVDRLYWQYKVSAYRRQPLRQLIARWNLRKIKRFEEEMLPTVAGLVAVSDADRQATQRLLNASQPCLVAPNGVDLAHYRLRDPQPATARLVVGFVGSLDLDLNQDAVLTLIHKILPPVVAALPERQVTLLIVGRHPPQWLIDLAAHDPHQRITLTGTVDDVLPYLHQMDLLVLPLQSGGGTKLRVLEAMAAGVPIIGSGFALMGLNGAQAHQHYLPAEQPEQFVTQIGWAAQNLVALQRLALTARRLVEARYGWLAITDQLAAEVEQLYHGRHGHSPIVRRTVLSKRSLTYTNE
jgi:glycosyltransferase involved in cell wall biosynthesis